MLKRYQLDLPGQALTVRYAPIEDAPAGTRDQLTREEDARIEALRRASVNPRTLRVYKAAWFDFAYFCRVNRWQHWPAIPKAVASYLASLSEWGLKRSTLQVRLAAIIWVHDQGFAAHQPGYLNPGRDPLVIQVRKGILRSRRTEKMRQAPALTTEQLALLVDALAQVFPEPRDHARRVCYKALILLGFAGAFRRDELVHIQNQHVTHVKPRDGSAAYYKITLPYSKTDQEGHGTDKFIKPAAAGNKAICPVKALDAWRRLQRDNPAGPFVYLFPSIDRFGNLDPDRPLSAQTLVNALKNTAEAVGLANAEAFTGHSLRAGFVMAALERGEPEWKVQQQTGHRSNSTLRRYTRKKEDGSSHASAL